MTQYSAQGAGTVIMEQKMNQKIEQGSRPKSERMDFLSSVSSNVPLHSLLFNEHGLATDALKQTLSILGLKNEQGAPLESVNQLTHQMVENVLQGAFFKKNAALFSFQVAEGAPPTSQQLEQFKQIGLVADINLNARANYDVGVVFGGLLEAVEGRTKNLLAQGSELKSIALLGGQRKLIEDKELGDHLRTALGADYYAEIENQGQLPTTETQMMRCVWDAFVRKDPSLGGIPVLTIDSRLRVGGIKEAPGTPETVVDLANTLTSGDAISGLSAAPASFLLSSSQPHGVRQLADFLSSFATLSYPQIATADVVAYPRRTEASLTLYGQELAKLVHAQLLARY